MTSAQTTNTRELKQLSVDAIPAALEKAKHYRLLNEPDAAESICRDILRAKPNDQETLIVLLLAMSDHIGQGYTVARQTIGEVLDQIEDDYRRIYYSGIVWERRALAQLKQGGPGSGFNAYDCLQDAMVCFEQAEKLRPAGNDDAMLRWNHCVRLIERNRLEARPDSEEFQLE